MENATLSKINLSVAEAAVALGISERGLRDEIAKGEIPVVRIGTRVLLRTADLESYSAERAGTWQPAAVGRGARHE
jgi:excisionase family DNA binding protein